MNQQFQPLIGNLWHSLGLAPLRVKADCSVTLAVDGFTLTLALSNDDHDVIVSTTAGELSRDPVEMGEQIARILKSNLCSLPYNRACCRLDRQTSPPAVMIEARSVCHRQFMSRLVETIGDVAHLAAERRNALGGLAQPTRRRVQTDELDDTVLVFRP